MPSPRVVLDTNIYLSAILFGGPPEEVLDLGRSRVIEILVSPPILNELAKVLGEKFGWSKERIEETIAEIKENTTLIEPAVELSVIKTRQKDNRILECAVEGNADYIVSGDKKHIQPLKEYQGIKILSAADFLALTKSTRKR